MAESITEAEWVAALTGDDVLKIMHAAIVAGDMPAVASALRLLAVKDPAAAQACLDALDLASLT